MKVFICSDVHGNRRALDAVLTVYHREYPCDVLFLGDAVGYGAHPEDCLDALLDLPRAQYVLGNHEAALLEEMERPCMNEIAAEAIRWTRGRVDARRRNAIRRRFRLTVESERFFGVHGSPADPEKWVYLISPRDADEAFSAQKFGVCFIGHTHSPAVFALDRGAMPLEEHKPFAIDRRGRYLINPGSVGQPRDGDPRAACLIFDSDEGTVTLHRCAYDIEGEAKDIMAAGLPAILADRLYLGS